MLKIFLKPGAIFQTCSFQMPPKTEIKSNFSTKNRTPPVFIEAEKLSDEESLTTTQELDSGEETEPCDANEKKDALPKLAISGPQLKPIPKKRHADDMDDSQDATPITKKVKFAPCPIKIVFADSKKRKTQKNSK